MIAKIAGAPSLKQTGGHLAAAADATAEILPPPAATFAMHLPPPAATTTVGLPSSAAAANLTPPPTTATTTATATAITAAAAGVPADGIATAPSHGPPSLRMGNWRGPTPTCQFRLPHPLALGVGRRDGGGGAGRTPVAATTAITAARRPRPPAIRAAAASTRTVAIVAATAAAGRTAVPSTDIVATGMAVVADALTIPLPLPPAVVVATGGGVASLP